MRLFDRDNLCKQFKTHPLIGLCLYLHKLFRIAYEKRLIVYKNTV
jgi:hypothetical protein